MVSLCCSATSSSSWAPNVVTASAGCVVAMMGTESDKNQSNRRGMRSNCVYLQGICTWWRGVGCHSSGLKKSTCKGSKVQPGTPGKAAFNMDLPRIGHSEIAQEAGGKVLNGTFLTAALIFSYSGFAREPRSRKAELTKCKLV